MKRVSIFSGAVLVALVSYAMMHLSAKKTARQAVDNGFAVVELFTSEGCSSCPAADEAVARLLNEDKANVYVLGFHVDYWNRLGWQDAYSSSKFSERQQQYSNILHLSSIYTPQVIVNGRTEFTGSDTRKLHAAVEGGLGMDKPLAIELSAKSTDGKSVEVLYRLAASSNNILNIALVQSHAKSNVKGGENSGKQLQHVNVVRTFTSLSPKQTAGQLTLTLPGGLAAADCRVIAYMQDANSWKITGAASAGIK